MKYEDGLQLLEYRENKGFWYRKDKKYSIKYILKESCENCKQMFFTQNKNSLFCTISCINRNRIWSEKSKIKISESKKGFKHSNKTKEKISIGNKGKKHSNETKLKMSELKKGKIHSDETKEKLKIINLRENNPFYGKKHSNKTKEKISKANKGKLLNKNNHFWKGGYFTNNIPTYDLYNEQLFADTCKRNEQDKNILEVKCTYCGKFFIPKLTDIKNRIQIINGNKNYKGELRLYCSEGCKNECPIYNQTKYSKGYKKSTSREVQPELRQLVLKRDNYTCVKCNSTENLHCHHKEGIRWNPLESADIDMCITVCKSCHIEIHKKDQCKYTDLQCKEN